MGSLADEGEAGLYTIVVDWNVEARLRTRRTLNGAVAVNTKDSSAFMDFIGRSSRVRYGCSFSWDFERLRKGVKERVETKKELNGGGYSWPLAFCFCGFLCALAMGVSGKWIKALVGLKKTEKSQSSEKGENWQAGSRQQSMPAGFEPDKSSWGWNWLERWMAVRPWENRFLDINLRDGVMICKDGSAEGNNGTNSQIKPGIKKPAASNLHANLSSLKTGPSHSGGSDSPPGKSENVLEAVNVLSSKPKSKPVLEDLVEEAGTRPVITSRSRSNPKERSIKSDKQPKKRLSLPNSGGGNGTETSKPSRTAAKATPGSHKPIKDRSKANGQGDSNPAKGHLNWILKLGWICHWANNLNPFIVLI
ncbi:hypothetical protein V6N13_039369 [Hibiscus sabdariffa]